MVRIFKYRNAIDIFCDVIEEDREAKPHRLPVEAYYFCEWLGEEAERCKTFDDLANYAFPNGADEDAYASVFREKWEWFAKECGCPEHYLKEGY